MTQKQIAEAFSLGKFELTFPHMDPEIKWTVIGEQSFEGKQAVIEQCKRVSEYFNSVVTQFNLIHLISENNKVVITGTAEFMRNGKRVNFISASDVYEFNENNQLIAISSYCIQEK